MAIDTEDDATGTVSTGDRSVPTVVGPPLFVLVVGLAAWQVVVTLTGVPTIILPSPLEVATATGRLLPTLLGDAAVTALTALLGLALGGAVGLGLSFAMVGSRAAAAVVHPYVIALRIAPLVAVAPLVFLWFGDGVGARALLVATMTLFPVTVAAYDGLRSTPERYLDLMRSVDAPSRAVFVRVRIPAAAPSVFAGVKLAATLSVIGTVVAEFLTLQSGIGYRLFSTSSALETEATFAALLVLSLLGLAFYVVPAAVERRLWT